LYIAAQRPCQCVCYVWLLLVITFRVSRRRRETYSGHARLCVCLSLAAYPHYCMHPDVTWGNGRGAPGCALLGGFAMQSVYGFRCYDNILPNAKCERVLVLAIYAWFLPYYSMLSCVAACC